MVPAPDCILDPSYIQQQGGGDAHAGFIDCSYPFSVVKNRLMCWEAFGPSIAISACY